MAKFAIALCMLVAVCGTQGNILGSIAGVVNDWSSKWWNETKERLNKYAKDGQSEMDSADKFLDAATTARNYYIEAINSEVQEAISNVDSRIDDDLRNAFESTKLATSLLSEKSRNFEEQLKTCRDNSGLSILPDVQAEAEVAIQTCLDSQNTDANDAGTGA